MPKSFEEVTQELEGLQARAAAAIETAESDSTKVEEVKSILDEIKPQIQTLTEERERAIFEAERKAMQGELTTLKSAIEDLRKAPQGFFGSGYDENEGKGLADGDDAYLVDGQISGFFRDVHLSTKNNVEALARLTHGIEGLTPEGKAAMIEGGTGAQGGYLVRPLVERQLVAARESDNILRQLCSKINVNTNSIQLDQLTFSATAGWVPELSAKPDGGTFALASVTANVFTAAGLAIVSNQLLADSNPSVDALAIQDITKRLVALEETAFLAGTGTNQPLGLLNTPGLGATTITGTGVDVLLDAVLDAISAVETAHGAPTAIVMHPRTWTRILKAKNAGGAYLFAPPSANNNVPADVTTARTIARGPQKVLWGYPVYTTNRMPTNLGTGTNESRVIVGDFREALILDRQGITVDESSHFYFTTNQTVFRAEERVGFTAARTPLAFNVVGGAGLANG